MHTAAEVAALSFLVPANLSITIMSGILSAIFRSVSGGATITKVEEGDVSLAHASSASRTDGGGGSPETPDIIVFKGVPYVYQGKQQGSPIKATTKMSAWRTEQLRRANPARVMDATPKPLATLYGPNSLPYARNPSGVDAHLDQPARPAQVHKDPATLFRERMTEHLDASKLSTPVNKSHYEAPAIIVDKVAPVEETAKEENVKATAKVFVPAPTTKPVDVPIAENSPKADVPRAKTANSSVLLAQINNPPKTVIRDNDADPFRPLFENVVRAQAADDADKTTGKADADGNWRKRDEAPQTVMTMDALFEKFSPSSAPIKVHSPSTEKVKRPLAERNDLNSSPRRNGKPGKARADPDKTVKPPVDAALPAKPTPASKAAKGTTSASTRSKPNKATPASKSKATPSSEPSTRRSLRA